MDLLSTKQKDSVLHAVHEQLSSRRAEIISENKKDLELARSLDRAMFDRLVINDKKVDAMMAAVRSIIEDSDPVGKEIYGFDHPQGMRIVNKTAPFGTILIIYESRPDVTIEAAMVAFKSNNKILLKGGKEAIHSNRVLVDCWHQALLENQLKEDWVQLLEYNREATQSFLKSPDQALDLIVPRGGDGLISFVKSHASCPVLISGRGNNFLYVHKDADMEKSISVILNAKTDKISACNALDKVLIDRSKSNLEEFTSQLLEILEKNGVQVLIDKNSSLESEWSEEYLAMKIAIGFVEGPAQAVHMINTHSGGHSATIMTESKEIAEKFMDEVDAAAVYHNVSTRFTDGGQFGMGAELAISTDKLHHRGPLGLHQLVTNKWYVFGDGQTR